MSSIPEIANQLVDKLVLKPNEDDTRTLFLIGSKSVGKSTLLYSFLDKTDPVRETLLMDYSFGRKSSQKQGLQKTICHIWEYGGKLEMMKNVFVSIPKKGKTCTCVMLDLSKIKSIWSTLETCIQSLTGNYEGSPIEIIIIGGKYDKFQNYDSEIKKVINLTIRSVALIFEAHILYYSCTDSQQLRKAKEMLHNIAFGNGLPFKDRNINYSKPLVIPKNSDTWENIGVPPSNIEKVKMRHLSHIPPETILQETKAELQRTHPEPIIESLTALKYDELRNLDPATAEYLGYIYNS